MCSLKAAHICKGGTKTHYSVSKANKVNFCQKGKTLGYFRVPISTSTDENLKIDEGFFFSNNKSLIGLTDIIVGPPPVCLQSLGHTYFY